MSSCFLDTTDKVAYARCITVLNTMRMHKRVLYRLLIFDRDLSAAETFEIMHLDDRATYVHSVNDIELTIQAANIFVRDHDDAAPFYVKASFRHMRGGRAP